MMKYFIYRDNVQKQSIKFVLNDISLIFYALYACMYLPIMIIIRKILHASFKFKCVQ